MRLAQLLCICLAAVAPAGQSRAQATGGSEPGTSSQTGIKSVLELFTSQSCSSCPPADALFQSYAARKDLITLTFNVDYWDYLGWKDTLGSRKSSERQRAYAKSRGDGMVYTPQIVVNGAAHVKGSDRTAIDAAIDRLAPAFAANQVPVALRPEKGTLVIELGEAGPTGGSPKSGATIWLAVVQRRGEVTIRDGENRGKKLAYSNIVRELTPVGMWSGAATTIRLERQAVMRPETEGCAVLVQQGHGGPIIGAAWLGSW